MKLAFDDTQATDRGIVAHCLKVKVCFLLHSSVLPPITAILLHTIIISLPLARRKRRGHLVRKVMSPQMVDMGIAALIKFLFADVLGQVSLREWLWPVES